MNIKSVVQFEVIKGEKSYVFSMPVGAPIGEAYDAAFECLNQLVEYSKQAAEKAKRSEESNG